MKTFLKLIFVSFLFFPLFAHAGTFNYTTPGIVKITTTDTTATYTITSTDPDGMYDTVYLCNSKDHPTPDTDCKKQLDLNIKGKGTETHTITQLNANATYYLYYDKISTGSTQYDYDFLFKTDPAKAATSNGYSLSVSQKDATIYANIKIPSTETRPLSLAFESLPTVVALREPIPETAAASARANGDVFSLDSDSKKLPLGSYQVYLEVDAAPLYTKLVGPYSFTFSKSSLIAGTDYQWPLTYNKDTSTFSGKISTDLNPELTSIKLEIASDSTFTNIIRVFSPVSIANDGSYSQPVSGLNPSTPYILRQTIQFSTTAQGVQTLPFNSSTGIIPTSGQPAQDEQNQKTYRLLAPLPGLSYVFDPDYCAEQKTLGNAIPAGAICDINDFINYIMKLLIGLAGVVLVLRIMYEGYRYMTTDKPGLKFGIKESIGQSFLGLLLALSAWIILNTINPQLVSNGIALNDVAAGIESFTISGGASFNGQPIKVDFKTDAYPKAVIAHNKTGVDTALILAMFDQESSSGANSGKCYPSTNPLNMKLADYNYLKDPLISTFNTSIKTRFPTLQQVSINSVNISCNSQGSDNGGAIGYTQFLPTTWKDYRAGGTTLLGHEPFPWDTGDALMMTGLFLKNHGGDSGDNSKQEAAACAYFGSCDNNHLINCNGTKTTYGACVMGKKVSIQQQIDAGLKDGSLKP